MITVRNVSKAYKMGRGTRTVLDDINLDIEKGETLGILGKNGSGKSTLIRLLSGAELPTAGTIRHGMRISWPIAFGGAFQGSLTGVDNLKFICRIYNADLDAVMPFISEFSELGAYLHEPVKSYSSGMAARLAFAASIAIEFDCYLIDEVAAVGDSRFHERCHEELFVKRRDRAKIIVSHQADFIRAHCERAVVLKDSRLHHFGNIEDAYAFYHGSMDH